jgi:hypothetical protein
LVKNDRKLLEIGKKLVEDGRKLVESQHKFDQEWSTLLDFGQKYENFQYGPKMGVQNPKDQHTDPKGLV